MSDADKLHVVVGASGGTGSALVRALLTRGRRVRAVNRSVASWVGELDATKYRTGAVRCCCAATDLSSSSRCGRTIGTRRRRERRAVDG
jgi:uncharacterized protein YbjT (DUF2867 family)